MKDCHFQQKGIALYLSLSILAILNIVFLSLLNNTLQQMKMASNAGRSVKAFFLADSGIEHGLYQIRILDSLDDIPSTPLGGGSYNVDIEYDGSTMSITSVGFFGGVKRAVEAIFNE